MADKINERKKAGKSWEEFKALVKQKEESREENVFAKATSQHQLALNSARDTKRRDQELLDLKTLRAARGLKKVKKKDKKEEKKKKKKKKEEKKKKKKKKKKKEEESSSSSSDSDSGDKRVKAARESKEGWKISSFLGVQ